MKRIVALLLALMLCGAAFAETRQGVVYLEGEPEPVTETLYRAGAGFSFWYDAEEMEVAELYGGAEIHVWPKADETVVLNIMPSEYAGELPWKWLELNAPEGTEYIEDETEDGSAIRWFSFASPYNETKLWSYYAVEGADDFIVAEGLWTVEADEGWGARLRHVLQTVAFGEWDAAAPDAPVTAQWWADADVDPDDCEAFEADTSEDAVIVVLTPMRTLRDFSLVSLSFDGFDADGGVYYSEAALATWPELAAGRPLVTAVAFYGDIPNNGIRFTDPETGLSRLYALEISGQDGALVLSPVQERG